MRKVRGVEQSHNSHKELLQQNVERQLKQIEGIIEDLMDGIDVGQLTLKERLNMTARFIDLYQRGVTVDNSLDGNGVASYESMAIESVIRRIRAKDEKAEMRVIDVKSAPYLVIEDGQDDWRPDETSTLAMDEDDLDD